MQANEMMIGWTTTASRAAAERLARGLVDAGLAACAQVSGPVTSYYRWRKKLEKAREFRVTVKFAAARARKVSAWLTAHHPYDTPQWVAVRADAAMKNYLKWVLDDPS
jgi:periplasmic divalent cation tolerance protein